MRPSTTRCANTCCGAKGFSKQKAQKNEMLPAALPVVQASKFELVTEVCYPFGRKHGRHRAVKRREFITLLGVAAAWPLAARAQQQPAMPVIGFLSGGSPNAFAHLVASFREGLSQTGYIEHRNVGIDYRWAEGRYDLLPTLAADLVNRGVAVIASTGGPRVVEAAAAATTTVPIVFLGSDVALKTGVLTSLNRPSGNVTGIVMSTSALLSKCLQFLSELVPKDATIGVLLNPNTSSTSEDKEDIKSSAQQIGRQIFIVTAGTETEIDTTFATLNERHTGGLVVQGDVLYTNRRDH